MSQRPLLAMCLVMIGMATSLFGQVCNVKIVTDGSPDCYDMDSFIRSVTGGWTTPEEKCWALFYWVHIGRRQTSPMIIHGVEVTDPIRQFNDFGYTMCSTVAGMNCALWHHLGFPVRFWDVTLHTVSECFYNDRWHMYDNSMSALYTLCDGRTIAGVQDLGVPESCTESSGKEEHGHVVRYHCLTATGPNGFLTGADCARDLEQEARCFHPAGLKLRTYYNNWEWGHRYILNIRPGESYTRYYHSLGQTAEFFVPNQGKDPESVNPRYRIRGNGIWEFRPILTPNRITETAYWTKNVTVSQDGKVHPTTSGEPAEIVFKIQSANITTSQVIHCAITTRDPSDYVAIAVSRTAGCTWQSVYKTSHAGETEANCRLVEEVNGAYEVLVKFTLFATGNPTDVHVSDIFIETRTMLNTKMQPQLRLGQNTVFVDLGDPADTIVIWPELQAGRYRQFVHEEKNIATEERHAGWHGVMFAEKPNEEAYVVYRVQAPRPITRIKYGGRFYNRVPKGRICLSHSFDGGQSWHTDWCLTDTSQPWDVIHYAGVSGIPGEHHEVLLKYSLIAPQAGPTACSIYSVRMQVAHESVGPSFQPFDVIFTWHEVQRDRTLVTRSHRQRVDRVPMRYLIDVGGEDHPIMESLRVELATDSGDRKYGYSDDRPGLGTRVLDFWQELGRNIMRNKPYTLNVQPTGAWGADDPLGTKLTDGLVGSNYAGGTAMKYAVGFDEKTGPAEITVDLGQPQKIAALGIHLTAGWPWWDALKGEIKDRIEALTSLDGKEYVSHGEFRLNFFRRDVPINHMLPDDETAQAWNHILPLPSPVTARFVRFRVTPRRSLGITEVQAFDRLERRPFSLRILLPDEQTAAGIPR